jgi:hypothetical protein
MQPKTTTVRIPIAAKRKLERVGKRKRWPLGTTVDEAADALLDREARISAPAAQTVPDAGESKATAATS